MLTFLSTAGIFFEIQWLLVTLLERTILHAVPATGLFIGASIMLLLPWLLFLKKFSIPYFHTVGSGIRDAWIFPVLLLVLLSAFFISNANGLQPFKWVSHGFYNGDTATWGALVQRSFLTTDLVSKNPFAGNGYLEYPALLHAGMATFLSALDIGKDWFHFLPLFTYVQIILTIPMFFLLWDVLYPEPANKAVLWLGIPSRQIVLFIETVLTGYILTLAWDTYIYPQSHFFLMGSFIFLGCLLIQANSISRKSIVLLVTAVLTGLVLIFSNAVTGTAALAVIAAFFAVQANSHKNEPTQRFLSILIIGLLGAFFFLAMRGGGSFRLPRFSYTAAGDMLRLAPVVMAIIMAISISLSYLPISVAGVMLLFALGFFTFFFSTRNIIIDNASRFFYHGIILGFPFLLGPVIRLYYWLRRELKYTGHTLIELVILGGGVVMVGLFFLLPAGASVKSSFDNLLFKDPQEISSSERDALWWIDDHAAPDSVFLASPQEPFAIPFFTGRAVLRTDYWLSPDDVVLEDVKAAFAGNTAARESVLSKVDYLYLRKDERTTWEPLPLKKAYDNGGTVIYKVR